MTRGIERLIKRDDVFTSTMGTLPGALELAAARPAGVALPRLHEKDPPAQPDEAQRSNEYSDEEQGAEGQCAQTQIGLAHANHQSGADDRTNDQTKQQFHSPFWGMKK